MSDTSNICDLSVEEWWQVFSVRDQGGYVKVTYGVLKAFETAVRKSERQTAHPAHEVGKEEG